MLVFLLKGHILKHLKITIGSVPHEIEQILLNMQSIYLFKNVTQMYSLCILQATAILFLYSEIEVQHSAEISLK